MIGKSVKWVRINVDFIMYCLRPGYSSEWIISSCKRPMVVFFLVQFNGSKLDSNQRHHKRGASTSPLCYSLRKCRRDVREQGWWLTESCHVTHRKLWTRHPVQSTVTSHCISPTTFLINQSQSQTTRPPCQADSFSASQSHLLRPRQLSAFGRLQDWVSIG